MIREMAEYRMPDEPKHVITVSTGVKIGDEYLSLRHSRGWSNLSWRTTGPANAQNISVFANSSVQLSDRRERSFQVIRPPSTEFATALRELLQKFFTARGRGISRFSFPWSRHLKALNTKFPNALDDVKAEAYEKAEAWVAENEFPSHELEPVEKIELPEPVDDNPERFWPYLAPLIQDIRFITHTNEKKIAAFLKLKGPDDDVVRVDIGFHEVYFLVNPEEREMLRRAITLALRKFIEEVGLGQREEENDEVR